MESKQPSQKRHCCYIRDMLVEQLKDEEKGVVFYSNVASELNLIGEDDLSDVSQKIADTELKHYLELRGIIDILTEECDCERKHIGPLLFGGQ